jgi:hypothetical protein
MTGGAQMIAPAESGSGYRSRAAGILAQGAEGLTEIGE